MARVTNEHWADPKAVYILGGPDDGLELENVPASGCGYVIHGNDRMPLVVTKHGVRADWHRREFVRT